MLGWDDAILGGLMVADFVYHRWIDSPTPAKFSTTEFQLPTVQNGAPYPLIYGRCRVTQPALMWTDAPGAMAGSSVVGLVPSGGNAQWLYGADMLFALGIPFDGSAANTRLQQVWAGDTLLQTAPAPATLDGNRGGSSPLWDHCDIGGGLDANTIIYGQLEFLNGNASQVLVDGSGNGVSNAGQRMKDVGEDVTLIPGYRNLASVFLFGAFSGTDFRFIVGPSPSVPALSFEVQSLPASWFGPNQQVAILDGDVTVQQGDANPIDVLYDLLTGTRGKLGLDPSRIDTASFTAAAAKLDAEGLGMSRCWDSAQPAGNLVDEIMQLIDGVIYTDPTTSKVKVKLVRNDYTVSALPVINPSNCIELQNCSIGGWTGVPNKIRVTFPDRGDDYRDGSATAQNMANAAGQDGQVREVQLQYPGCCHGALAQQLAARELAARSRPLLKCRALCDRSFYQTCPGDVVVLNWPEYGISGYVMRVAAVSRGTIEDEKIALDLMQDTFWVWSGIVHGRAGVGFPASGGGLRH